MLRGSLVGAACLAVCAVFAEQSTASSQSPSQLESSGSTCQACTSQAVRLEDGTPVRLRTTKDISSGKSKEGEELRLKVASDVVVGDLVVIRRGAEAVGRVTSAKKNGMMGRAGRLAIEITSVETATGEPVALRAEQKLKGEGRTVDIIGAIGQTYGLGAPVFIWFRGDNVTIGTGRTLTAFVNGDMLLDDVELRAAQPPRQALTGFATVFLLRPEKGGAKDPVLYCGAVAMGQLRSRHFIEARLPPGDYLLQSPKLEATVRLHAAPDHSYYIQFRPNRFFVSGYMELIDSTQGDDLLAFPWWTAEPKVDLSGVDPMRLQDTKQVLEPGAEREHVE